jgi:hypothetical protein
MKNITLYLLVLIGLSSCEGLAIKENIFGNYYLVAADIGEDLSLSYHEGTLSDVLGGVNYDGLIEPTVFAVGYNDKYIIVAQHPNIYDRKITNYFILPIKKGMNWRTKNGLIGPLSLTQFNAKRRELGISDELTFTRVFEDLK